MKQTLFITVRYSSSRLPGKCLLQLGDFSVLGHCIARSRAAGFNVIVCTGTDSADIEIVRESVKYNSKVFRGNSLNKILRWSSCFENFGLDYCHIIDGDDPYFDPLEINRSLDTLVTKNLDLVRTSFRSDSGFASVGLSVSAKFMKILAERSLTLKSQNLDVIPWNALLSDSDKWEFLPDNYLTKNKLTQLRLTLDYPEDLQLLQRVAENFKFSASRTDIEEFLLDNPDILKVNFMRNEDFKQNKRVQLAEHFND
jgi:spore coat polysaccharide biosynthesis protein SpsF